MTTQPAGDQSISSQERSSFLYLFSGPFIWLLHFLLSYMTSAILCASHESIRGSLEQVRFAIMAFTLIAMVLLILIIRRGLRQCRPLSVLPWQDAATRHHRRRFLAFTMVLLAGLSGMAVLYTALAVVMIGHCL